MVMVNKNLVFAVGRYSHMGFLMLFLSVGGFFLGKWIDDKIWRVPVFGIILFFVGFALWLYKFVLMMEEDRRRKMKKKEEQE